MTGGAVGSAPHVTLDIEGMTCASCANRVESTLNNLDGVEASVNFATEQATVTLPDHLTVDDVVTTVSQAGYAARPVTQRGAEAYGGEVQGRDHSGPEARSRDRLSALRRRLLITAVLAVPVVAMAMVSALQFRGWQWVSLALATPVVVWGGWPFHRAAWLNLRHRAATMDTLVSLGTLAAFGWSVWALVWGHAGTLGMRHPFEFTIERTDPSGSIYLEVAAGVTVFVLAGRYAEARAKRQSSAAMRALLSLGASEVAVLRDGVERRVPIDELSVGEDFVVRPGEKVATDGVVVDGATAVDTSMITGEPLPVDVAVGDAVVGGTISVSGRILVRATGVGADTQLAQMARLVESAQAGKAPVQRLADRISAVFVPVVIGLAVATAVGWLVAGAGWSVALSSAVAVLIIACPCALGLATPTAILVGTGRGAELGIIIKGPEALEATRRIDTIVLDKTGTITTGQMKLVAVTAHPGTDADEVLRLAALLEDGSAHPIARAIVDGNVSQTVDAVGDSVSTPMRDDKSISAPVHDFESINGRGVRARVSGLRGDRLVTDRLVTDRLVTVGSPRLIAESGMSLHPDLERTIAEAGSSGDTAVLVGWDDEVRGVLTIADSVKPTSAQAVSELSTLGLTAYLLTGDNPHAAHHVAAAVGIDPARVIAGVLPEDKATTITGLQAEGRVVSMVGDGVNDTPALATADLGIAMGTGTDAAIEAADITLMRGDPLAAVDSIRLSRRTFATIRANLVWAFGYNVAAIPLAMAGLLNPLIAGAAMALSSVFVVTNSLRLRGFRPLTPSTT